MRRRAGDRVSQKKQSQNIRYAVVGLGHLAQVAVLPAFKNAPNSELAAIVWETQKNGESWARNTD